MTDKPRSPAPDALVKGKKSPDVVTVPAWSALSTNGEGAPGDLAFTAAVGALYGIAYTIRFTRKAEDRLVFKVGPLVGEWRAEGVDLSATEVPSPESWRWRLLIPLPDDADQAELASAVEAATSKRGGKLEDSEEARRLELVRTESVRFARILHVGPYATEPESFAARVRCWRRRGLSGSRGTRRSTCRTRSARRPRS